MDKNFAESTEEFYQAGHSLVKLLLDITTPDFEALHKANHERMKNTISHDIAHCSNESCPAKDRCKRFRLHLEALAKGIQFASYLLLTEESKERAQRLGSCPHFLLNE
jgi:MinD superfamily P-loop ATPase